MAEADRKRWDEKHALRPLPTELQADEWVAENTRPLVAVRALDLACGVGRNAIWLASQGWTVDAVDVSPVGLSLANQLAKRHNQQVHWIEADLDVYAPAVEEYDLVIVTRFLERAVLPVLIERALRPGGVLIYETFTQAQQQRADNHIRRAEFLLASGELPRLFPSMLPILYREVESADRSVARLLARKACR